MTVSEEQGARYRRSLRPRVDVLRSALKDLASGDPEALEAIRLVTHVLRGSGATYGYPEISAAAATVEEAPSDALEEPVVAMITLLEQIARGSRVGSTGGGRSGSQVLVVQSDPELSHLLRVLLEGEGFEVSVVRTADEAFKVVRTHAFSLVFTDLVLPDTDGRKLIMRLRERPETAGVPVMVLSGRTSPRIRSECLALGADAYIEKPFEPTELLSDALGRLRGPVAADVALNRDPMTGLPNRSDFEETFQEMRSGDQPFVALIELDRFHTISEGEGWSIAESVLRSVGDFVRRLVSDADGPRACRWEGPEFAVLLDSGTLADAEKYLEGVVRDVRDLEQTDGDGEPFRVTATVAAAAASEADELESVVEVVRRRVHRGQRAGGNRVSRSGETEAEESLHVLLAEDDEVTAALVQHRLVRDGFTVEWYPNGSDAYEGAMEADPDLVILDVKMPGMDGFELLQKLRKTPAYSDTPIVLLTAVGGESDLVRGFDLGADDYIVKPFSPSELTARVRRLIKRNDNPDH